ncbi:MAG: hypothetical protein K2O60_05175, partial [Ruminococcus sp.]|nr:hypothetical protein [Ruminococcus sp.]
MKKSDYKNHLDRIKCSDEFKTKMETILSAEPDGEYADSVSHVEYAPKVNWSKWGAFAASAVLITGLCGLAVINLKGGIDSSMMSSDIETSSDIEAEISDYRIALSVMGEYSKPDGHYTSFGALPDDAVKEIMTAIKEFTPADDTRYLNNTKSEALTLTIRGAESYTLNIDSNGCLYIDRDGEKSTEYNAFDLYKSLCGIIAKYLPYCDWNCIVGNIGQGTGRRLSEAFANHIDEFEIIDNYDADETEMRFFSSGSFGGVIKPDGSFRILYDNEKQSVCFRSSPEFYEEVYSGVTNQLSEKISSTKALFYTSSQGQSNYNFSVQDTELLPLCEAVEKLKWMVHYNGERPSSAFYGVNTLEISTDGTIIYDSQSNITYTAENQDTSIITDTLEEIVNSDKTAKLLKMIVDSENLTSTIEGNVEFYYTCYVNDEAYYLGGTGYTVCDVKNKCQYTTIENDTDSYYGEFIMQKGEWQYKEWGRQILNINGNNTDERVSEGGLFFNLSVIAYENIRRSLYDYIRNM